MKLAPVRVFSCKHPLRIKIYKISASPQRQNQWVVPDLPVVNIYFLFILLFSSSSPCSKDQFAVSYLSKDHSRNTIPTKVKMIPYLSMQTPQNNSLSGSTYLTIPYMGVPLPSPPLPSTRKGVLFKRNLDTRIAEKTKRCTKVREKKYQ